MERRKTRQIHIGPITIGGDAPISVQSMTNTKTTDTAATVAQIHALEAAGCEIVRVTVPTMEAALTKPATIDCLKSDCTAPAALSISEAESREGEAKAVR